MTRLWFWRFIICNALTLGLGLTLGNDARTSGWASALGGWLAMAALLALIVYGVHVFKQRPTRHYDLMTVVYAAMWICVTIAIIFMFVWLLDALLIVRHG